MFSGVCQDYAKNNRADFQRPRRRAEEELIKCEGGSVKGSENILRLYYRDLGGGINSTGSTGFDCFKKQFKRSSASMKVDLVYIK